MATPETSNQAWSALDQLLSSKAAEGSLESTSAFTIDSLKARQKLAESQLPGKGLWVVKLIQAAVSSGATSAEIQFGKREVVFRFEVADWPWEPRAMVRDLLSGVLPSETTLFHLFAGLRNSVFEHTVKAQWTIATREKTLTVNFGPEGTEVVESPGRPKASFELKTSRPPRWPGFKKAAPMPVKHLLRQTAEEFMAVQGFCWSCPIPLKFDGRHMETRYHARPEWDAGALEHLNEVATYRAKPVALVRRCLPGDPAFEVPWAIDEGPTAPAEFGNHDILLKRDSFMGQVWMEWPLPRDKTRGGYLLLLFGPQMKSRVEFICDGAAVDTAELDWSSKNLSFFGRDIPANQFKIGVRVLLPVEATQLDLSHFGVRQKSELVDGKLSELGPILKETCEAILEHQRKFSPRFVPQPKNVVTKVAAGYIKFLSNVHPIFHYLKKYGFRSEVRSLLESVESGD